MSCWTLTIQKFQSTVGVVRGVLYYDKNYIVEPTTLLPSKSSGKVERVIPGKGFPYTPLKKILVYTGYSYLRGI